VSDNGWTEHDDRHRHLYALRQDRKRQIARLESRLAAAQEARQQLDEQVSEIMVGIDLDRELALLLERA
jgi:hypothetical protein